MNKPVLTIAAILGGTALVAPFLGGRPATPQDSMVMATSDPRNRADGQAATAPARRADQRSATVGGRHVAGPRRESAANPRPDVRPLNTSGVPTGEVEISAFVVGYIEPQKARVLRSTSSTYESLLSELSPPVRRKLRPTHLDLAWQLAMAVSEEELHRLDAMRTLVETASIGTSEQFRTHDPTVISTGTFSWAPPADHPSPGLVSFAYRIREADYRPYTDAWRRRGVVRGEWTRAIREIERQNE